LLPPLFAAGLFLAFHATAGVRDTNASVNVKVNANGQYELALANIGDGIITSFTFVPASTMHVTSVVSSDKGTCQIASPGFSCSVMLNPPPCACTAGDSMTVVFTGSGEIAGSKVDVMGVGITVTGTGAVGTTTSQTTTRQTTTNTTTATPPPPQPKVEKLSGSVGPKAKIAFAHSAKAGKAQITVRDMSKTDNFHLSGPGVNKLTSVAGKAHAIWHVTLRKGLYRFRSDRTPTAFGTFRAV